MKFAGIKVATTGSNPTSKTRSITLDTKTLNRDQLGRLTSNPKFVALSSDRVGRCVVTLTA